MDDDLDEEQGAREEMMNVRLQLRKSQRRVSFALEARGESPSSSSRRRRLESSSKEENSSVHSSSTSLGIARDKCVEEQYAGPDAVARKKEQQQDESKEEVATVAAAAAGGQTLSTEDDDDDDATTTTTTQEQNDHDAHNRPWSFFRKGHEESNKK